MIEIEGVCVGYGGKRVLEGVSASVAAGQVFGVLGPNGSGKTTLVRALLGILLPSAGRVLLRGKPVGDYPRREFARLVSAAPQEAVSDFSFTVAESVLLGRTPHLPPLGLEGPDDLAAATRAMERVDLGAVADRPLHAVSGGELRRAIVARALAQDAEVLILDEPTAALDVMHQIQILEILREEAARGRTVIVILHDLNLAASYCDRLLLLAGGKVAAEGSVEEVLTYRRVLEVYGVDVYVGINEISGGRFLVPFRDPAMKRRLHRLLGAVLALQLAIWLVTGVLFNVKHRYAEAYETLAAPPAEVSPTALVVSPAQAAQAAGATKPPALHHDSRGYAYLFDAVVIDAQTGRPRPPLDETGARELLARALAASPHRARYGAVAHAKLADRAWQLDLSTGQRITVDSLTGELTHTAPLNDFIDWSYRFHYMQYTPWRPVNIAIVLGFVGLTALLLWSGLAMLLSRARR